MKISELTGSSGQRALSPLKGRVLAYLEMHSEEVFSYRDESLLRDLDVKPSALGFTLWALHRDGLIEKQRVGGKVYFGSHEAVSQLRAKLGVTDEDAFERAHRNLERIRAEVGNINTQELLDEVRGPWG